MTDKPARSMRRRVLATTRRYLGRGNPIENEVRSARNIAKFRMGRDISRRDFYAYKNEGSERLGIYGMGGCDVLTIVRAGPQLRKLTPGSGCIAAVGKAAHARSDLLLQTLDPPPPELTADVAERLNLDPEYFSPRLFTPTFTVPDQRGLGSFPKDVVVLSLSTDTSRTLYRHREHGYLVDPGGWWLTTDMEAVLQDLSAVKWFTSTFKKVGRISVEQSMDNFEKIITVVRERTGAFVVMMNVLTVDPGIAAMDYKLSNSPNRVRRREFAVAVTELARKLDFPVLDVDRAAKVEGISGQADFVHYTLDQKRTIARDFIEILQGHGVVPVKKVPAAV